VPTGPRGAVSTLSFHAALLCRVRFLTPLPYVSARYARSGNLVGQVRDIHHTFTLRVCALCTVWKFGRSSAGYSSRQDLLVVERHTSLYHLPPALIVHQLDHPNTETV
jgi:hypothetical protein